MVRRNLIIRLSQSVCSAFVPASKWAAILGCNISLHVKVMAAVGVIKEASELAKDRWEWWWRKSKFRTVSRPRVGSH